MTLPGARHPDSQHQPWTDAADCLVPRSDPGLLVTVSGFDGVGKSTQVRMLEEHFASRGRSVSCTRQPSTQYRRLPAMRAYTRDGGSVRDAQVLAVLAAADRYRHVAEYLAPRLDAGEVVICDRYVYDFFAVFAHRGLAPQFLMELSVDLPKPDVAFLLRADTRTVVRRLRDREDDSVREAQKLLRHEEKQSATIADVLRWYDTLAPLLTTVDATAEQPVVSRRLLASVVEVEPSPADLP